MNKTNNSKSCLPFVIVFIIFFAFLFFMILCAEIYIFMLLWNWLTPLFWNNAPMLTFWQTLGIILLLDIIGGILFKNKL